jgi:hypothetical protein
MPFVMGGGQPSTRPESGPHIFCAKPTPPRAGANRVAAWNEAVTHPLDLDQSALTPNVAALGPAPHWDTDDRTAEGIGNATRGVGLAFPVGEAVKITHAGDVAEIARFPTGIPLRVRFWDHLASKGKRRSGPERTIP